jgi:hypothetical protein
MDRTGPQVSLIVQNESRHAPERMNPPEASQRCLC